MNVFERRQTDNAPRKFRSISLVATFLSLLLGTSALAAQQHGGAHGDHGEDHSAHEAMLSSASSGETSPVEISEPPSIPDVQLFDQDGKKVSFFSDLVEGKRVAVNFVFTTCTTICPPMGAHFGKLQGLLGDRLGEEVNLISVSVDPIVDTPARLKSWSQTFERQEGWTLVTGPKTEVDALLKALGAFTPDKSDHAPLVLVGDEPNGTWRRVYGLAPPARLAEAIDALDQTSASKGGPHDHHGEGHGSKGGTR